MITTLLQVSGRVHAGITRNGGQVLGGDVASCHNPAGSWRQPGCVPRPAGNLLIRENAIANSIATSLKFLTLGWSPVGATPTGTPTPLGLNA